MKKLPKNDYTSSLLVRTDFSDDSAWVRLCAACEAPSEEPGEEDFAAILSCISDPTYDGLTVEQLVELAPKDGDRTFLFIADRIALTAC